METHSLTHSLFTLSLTHSHTLPAILRPSQDFFPLVGLWWAEGAGFLLGLSLPSRFRTAALSRRTWWRERRGDDRNGFDILWNQL